MPLTSMSIHHSVTYACALHALHLCDIGLDINDDDIMQYDNSGISNVAKNVMPMAQNSQKFAKEQAQSTPFSLKYTFIPY
jgi:hypothetical protein